MKCNHCSRLVLLALLLTHIVTYPEKSILIESDLSKASNQHLKFSKTFSREIVSCNIKTTHKLKFITLTQCN